MLDGDEIVDHDVAAAGSFATDFVILGTGFASTRWRARNSTATPTRSLLWQDRYHAAAEEENTELGKFPYLADDFTFTEREPGRRRGWPTSTASTTGAAASLGKVSGDIPGISEGARWLAREIAAKLYAENIDQHWQRLLDYDTPELRGDEWTASPLPDDARTAVREAGIGGRHGREQGRDCRDRRHRTRQRAGRGGGGTRRHHGADPADA